LTVPRVFGKKLSTKKTTQEKMVQRSKPK